MYFEEIAKLTADHIRTHIQAYLNEIALNYTDGVNLIVPKSVDPTSVVGGIWTQFDDILPQYGIDVLGKTRAPDDASLWTYEYPGQINGMVSASSSQVVDKLCWRHGWAIEMFVRRHQFMHQVPNPNFTFLELTFGGVDMSGAEEIPQPDGSAPIWIAGFSVNVSWFTSEDGPSQHG